MLACQPHIYFSLLQIRMLYTLTTHLHRHVFHFSAVVLGRRAVQSSLSKETGKVSLIINLAKQLRWCPSTPSVQVTTKCACQEYFIGNVKCNYITCDLHLIFNNIIFIQKVFLYFTLISNHINNNRLQDKKLFQLGLCNSKIIYTTAKKTAEHNTWGFLQCQISKRIIVFQERTFLFYTHIPRCRLDKQSLLIIQYIFCQVWSVFDLKLPYIFLARYRLFPLIRTQPQFFRIQQRDGILLAEAQ